MTHQNAEQEAEQLERGADVGEVGLMRLHGHQQLVKPGQLQLRLRPHVGTQRHLQERNTSPGQQLTRRTNGRGSLIYLRKRGEVNVYLHQGNVAHV